MSIALSALAPRFFTHTTALVQALLLLADKSPIKADTAAGLILCCHVYGIYSKSCGDD
jgi:hypothetical protein